jgi:bifunctional non-homologous end joining protein LigD
VPGYDCGVPDKLETYRGKRDRRRTPEPVPAAGPLPKGNDDTFVIQEHHARRLHWDFRLERDGVLVSWALPKGLPLDPKRNNLAVHTEDHPLDYASFEGEIPAGEYGGGSVTIWDRGTYELEKWRDDEVIVVLHGSRPETGGRFALFQTRGKDWMIHRMDAPAPVAHDPLPELIRPQLAVAGQLPSAADDAQYAYEMKWDGVRAVVYADRGSVRVMTRNDREVVRNYPELRGLGPALGSHPAVLDGEIVAFDPAGRPSFGVLQQRRHVGNPSKDLLRAVPVTFLAFDVLHLDGRSTLDLAYDERRALLESLELAGAHWQVPPAFHGDGPEALRTSKETGLEGVVAKRRDAAYAPGERARSWIKVKNLRAQEVVIGGWKPGEGWRSGGIGSLLLGIPGPDGLTYVGHVGTGFTVQALEALAAKLRRLERASPPFAGEVPRPHAKDAHWVTPKLVGEVVYTEWTRDRRLRHPVWRGLRPDKSADEVVLEE